MRKAREKCKLARIDVIGTNTEEGMGKEKNEITGAKLSEPP